MRPNQKNKPSAHPFFKTKTAPASTESEFNAHYRQAHAAYTSNDLAQAEQAIDLALNLRPKSVDALNLKAILCAQQNRASEAERAWRTITQLDPTQVNTFSNLGNLYRSEKRFTEAEQSLLKAITLSPQHFDALLNLGVVCYELKQPERALAYYDQAIALNPNNAKVYFNKARLLQEYLDFEQAIAVYRQALVCDPTHQDARANLLFLQYYHVPFNPVTARDEALRLGHHLSAATKKYTVWQCPPRAARPLKVGLVSADLRLHPVSHFLKQILPHINTAEIELYAYANSNIVDTVTQSLQPHFKQWLNITHMGDASVAKHIHKQQIDILIDLTGQTADNRLGVFAIKPAPIQVSWLGYFATTGLPEMNYVLADPICVPADEEYLFSEKIARMPHSRLHLYRPEIVSQTPLPCTQGRPFTFGCFQNLAKINDEVLSVWAQILQQAPHAQLRLQTAQFNNEQIKNIFIKRLHSQGIDSTRVFMHSSSPYAEFIQAHAEIDILLDTFPYPGGTTTVESMWQGVPTLTLATTGMLGRQGEQLLTAAGLSEWVCHGKAMYIEKAVHYATLRSAQLELAQLRTQMANTIALNPASDAKSFAHEWAQALLNLG